MSHRNQTTETTTLRFDESTASVDINAMIMAPERTGVVILPWGSRIPRIGDRFEYDEGGTRYLLEAVRYHPRAPSARMRRHYTRPDYWLTARLERVVELQVESQPSLPFATA